MSDQSGVESTDIGSQSPVHDMEETTGAPVTSMSAESFDCDSASATKAIIDEVSSGGLAVDTASHLAEEGRECVVANETDSSKTDAEKQNGIMDLSTLETSRNTHEDTENSVIDALVPGDELLKIDDTVDLELKVATSLESDKFDAASDDGSTDSTPISPLVGTNSGIDATTPTPTQGELGVSLSSYRIAPPPQSATKEVKKEIYNTDAVFYERKRMLRSKRSDLQRSPSVVLLSLPIDSLHSIASFLTPLEWRSFGQCNKSTNKIGREIFRRVRMHGFRCATEVVTAWVSCLFLLGYRGSVVQVF